MKKKTNHKNTALNLGLVLCLAVFPSVHGHAQSNFSYQANLDTIRQAAFYKITLQPGLVAKSRADLADLRIGDQQGRFISYVLKNDQPVLSKEGFRELPILSNEKFKDSITEIVIANEASLSVSSLLFFIRNISARRTCTFSGSDDKQKWFVIREHIGLEDGPSPEINSLFYIQTISFPPSNYRFFKMSLDDKGLLPINVLKAGISTHSVTNGKYLEIPDPVLYQKDSNNKHSYITLQYGDNYRIDRLGLTIQGPVLYKRYVRIYDSTMYGRAPIKEISIDPSNTTFLLPFVKTNRLLIDITNEDDTPLLLKKAATEQLNLYLLAYLQPGSGYHVLTGDPKAVPPAYDLKYFVDSLTRDPQEIFSGPILSLLNPVKPITTAPKNNSQTLLWCIIALVLALLISLSIKMVKAISQKDLQKDKDGNDRL
ncbi:hypothetical protein ACX0G9_20420 [Flavitalea flava]